MSEVNHKTRGIPLFSDFIYQGFYDKGFGADTYKKGDYVKLFLSREEYPVIGFVVKVLPEINRLDVFFNERGLERVSPEDILRINVDTGLPTEMRVPDWQLERLNRLTGFDRPQDERENRALRIKYKQNVSDLYGMEDPSVNPEKEGVSVEASSKYVSIVGFSLVAMRNYFLSI